MLKGIKFKSGTNNPPPTTDIYNDKRAIIDSPTHQEAFAWEEQPKKKKWKKDMPTDDKLQENVIETENIEKEEEKKNKKLENIKNCEEKIDKLCQQMWDCFLKNEVSRSARACENLIKEQKNYYGVLSGTTPEQEQRYITKSHNPKLFSEQKTEESSKNPISFRSRENMINDRVQDKKVEHDYDDQARDFFHKYKNIINKDDYNDQEYVEGVVGKEEDPNKIKLTKSDKKRMEKIKNMKRAQESRAKKATDRLLSNCSLCLANNRIWEEQIICCGSYTMLMMPKQRRYESFYYVYITAMDHFSSSLEVDEEVYDEIRNFMKCLVMAADKKDMCAIFFETAINLKKLDHFFLECVIIPANLKNDVEMYFKKSLSEIESEWSVHKKIIEIRREKGGIRKQIPKNFPFFYVDFNMTHGYAHVIEKENEFSKEDHHEVLATALRIDKHKVLRPEHVTKGDINKMREDFIKFWDEFDWTKHM